MVNNPVSSVWHSPGRDDAEMINACLETIPAPNGSACKPLVFFRADDIGAPGIRFTRMMKLFTRNRIPLCLATVPAWLTKPRWKSLLAQAGPHPDLWCWHQHGWRHANHEPSGKKGEFGHSRNQRDIHADITRGKQRLEAIMGRHFYPAFTPPWNRCSSNALDSLNKSGFRAVSRTPACQPAAPNGLPDIPVSVDLHTRKETDPQAGRKALFAELEQSLAGGLCGIMIHHQRMNEPAFDFLDTLLSSISRCRHIRAVSFRELLAGNLIGYKPR